MGFRWGVAGYGWVARDHMAPGLREAGHELMIVADPDPAARSAAEQGGALAVASLAQLVEAAPDALYVATPNHLHLGPVTEAAAAGLPVLCEKPMAASLADAEAMVEAAEGRTLLGTAFNQRHHPAHRAIADLLRAGAIGTVTAVRIHYACWLGPSWQAAPDCSNDNWRADPVAAGGGAVMDLALHGLDLAEMLVAEPLEALSVMLQRKVHDYAVDDGGMLTGRFAGGALLQSHVAYNCPEVLPRRRLEILGTEGMIVASDTMGQTAGGRITLTCGKSAAASEIAFDASASPFAAQAEAFAAAVRGEAHDFSAIRDLRLMTLFTEAYAEADPCR